MSFNISFRDKFSGCPHPSNVSSHFATVLKDVQRGREVTHVSHMCPSQIHPRLFHQSLFVVSIDTSRNEQDSSILMSVGPPPSSGKELPAVTFDVDHVYVLSRPHWTRCMSQQLRPSACGPTKMALSGTHEQDVGLCLSGTENACRGFGSSLTPNPMQDPSARIVRGPSWESRGKT